MQRVAASWFLVLVLGIVIPRDVRAAAVHVGDGLPVVALPDWQGVPVNLAETRPRVMIVDFWASWCEPCREALPRLDAISRRYAADGLQVFAVNIDKTRTPADAFLKQHVPTPAMTLLHDPDGAALARYGAAGMPALYVVDQRGVVRLVESGFTADRLRSVEEVVTQLLTRSDRP